jgi:hypothetical protein
VDDAEAQLLFGSSMMLQGLIDFWGQPAIAERSELPFLRRNVNIGLVSRERLIENLLPEENNDRIRISALDELKRRYSEVLKLSN